MSFSRPTLGALTRDAQAALLAQLPGTDPTLRRSNLWVIARVFAGLQHLVYGFLDWIFRQVIPDTAEGEYLDRWCRIYAIARKPAASAAGNVVLTGINGTTIAAGAQLVRSDGVLYATLAAATIASGTATVAVQALAGGVEGNADEIASLSLVVAVAGINGTTMVAAGGLVGGAPQESDASFRARLLARIQAPPQGGAANDYVQWALQIAGVTRAWCYPRNRGAGTVDVAFVTDGPAATGGSIIPGAPKVAEVQANIDALRPVCDDCIVFAPTAAPLNVTITGLSNDTTTVRNAITAELKAQILRDAIPGGTVYKSRLIEAVSRAVGEVHHSMTVPAGDVTTTAGAIATPGLVTFA